MPPDVSGPGPDSRAWRGAESAEDGALLARIAERDAAAFRIVCDRHLGPVTGLARRILGDDAEAEDIAQETFLRLWRSGGAIEIGPSGLRPWLRRVASNLCIDRVRSRRRVDVTDEVPEKAEPASQQLGLEQQHLAERVSAALQGLPERQRIALTLFHYEGLSMVEVGALLEVSDEAVESLLGRARRSLKATLAADWRALLPDTET